MLAETNKRPGTCCKCKGTGYFGWKGGAGRCFSCRGTGKQDRKQIQRNTKYNRYANAAISTMQSLGR